MKTKQEVWSEAIKAAAEECRRIARMRKEIGLENDAYYHMAALIEENLWKAPE